MVRDRGSRAAEVVVYYTHICLGFRVQVSTPKPKSLNLQVPSLPDSVERCSASCTKISWKRRSAAQGWRGSAGRNRQIHT